MKLLDASLFIITGKYHLHDNFAYSLSFLKFHIHFITTCFTSSNVLTLSINWCVDFIDLRILLLESFHDFISMFFPIHVNFEFLVPGNVRRIGISFHEMLVNILIFPEAIWRICSRYRIEASM